MTNEQLYLYMQSLITELKVALYNISDLLPKDTPRYVIKEWKLKPEYHNRIILLVEENMKEYYEIEGDIIALFPLDLLINNLEERVNCLLTHDRRNESKKGT